MLSDPRADSQLIAQTLNNLGFTCQALNRLVEAQQYFEQAVAKYRETSTAFSPEYAVALHNLGRFMHRQGDNKLAWDYLTQELQLWKQTKEPGHMHYVATCLYSLGEIMADTGEYNGARRNFEQALEL